MFTFKTALFFLFLTVIQLTAQTILTEKAYRGHVQGIAVDETGIYCSFAHDMMKSDFSGKTICRIKVPSHAGDVVIVDKKLYCAVSLWYQKDKDKYGASNCIFIYDQNLKLLEVKPFKDLHGFDGIAFINGKFYVGLNSQSNRPRNENKIAIFDRNFKLLKTATVSIGCPTKFGAQTLSHYKGKLLAAFYGGGKRAFIFEPDELQKSNAVVKPIGVFPDNLTVGFSELPSTIAAKGTMIIARNSRMLDPKTRKRKYGIKLRICKMDEKGVLQPANLNLH